jgi:hypothetical protein
VEYRRVSGRPETISFYSYKGGTGRSLAVAHIADYLSSFGKSVLAIDMDLEAPGLHYKLSLVSDEPPVRIRGLVDLMHSYFTLAETLPNSLKDYCVEVVRRDNGGTIRLLPAGDVRKGDYWAKLARLNWHDLFYSDFAKGVPFFLEIVARLSAEFKPDYILIDSRTGITELGGVASTILPDKFVCVFTNSVESLEGTREVLRSVGRTPRLPGKQRIELIPVLARLPDTLDSEMEDQVKIEALNFLNEPADSLAETLTVKDLTILHSEPFLQLQERVLTRTSYVGADELPLMRDYLRLFARLIPRDVVEPHITNLVNRALSRVMDDPDAVEKDLEAVAAIYPHEESYRALLRFYRLRRAPGEVVLRAAARLWQMTGNSLDPLLQEAVETHFPAVSPRTSPRDLRVTSELAERTWLASGAKRPNVGLAIARLASTSSVAARSINLQRILSTLLEQSELSEDEAIDVLRVINIHKLTNLVPLHIARLRSTQRGPRFQAILAEALLDAGAIELIRQLIDSSELDLVRLRTADLSTYSRTLHALDRGEELAAELQSAYESAMSSGDIDTMVEVGKAYRSVGHGRAFEQQMREDDSGMADDVITRVRDERVALRRHR